MTRREVPRGPAGHDRDVHGAVRAAAHRVGWDSGDRAFPAIGWPALRHSFATTMLANGVDLRTAHNLMRYKTTAKTMRYAHSTSEQRRAAVGKVLA